MGLSEILATQQTGTYVCATPLSGRFRVAAITRNTHGNEIKVSGILCGVACEKTEPVFSLQVMNEQDKSRKASTAPMSMPHNNAAERSYSPKGFTLGRNVAGETFRPIHGIAPIWTSKRANRINYSNVAKRRSSASSGL
jgi:hypothetical protein